MKKFIGLFILLIIIVLISGCTQQAKPAAAETAVPTTVVATEVPTLPVTPELTTIPATVSTTAAAVTANVTAVATPTPSTTFSRTNVIHIRNNTFVPSQLVVLPGTGISWINDDSVIHTVKATGEFKGKFVSADIVSGAQFSYTFGETQGTFEFTDSYYPEMKGTIIVKKGETIVGAPTMQTPA